MNLLSVSLLLIVTMVTLQSCQRVPPPPGELDANPKPVDVGDVLVGLTGSTNLLLSNSASTGKVDFGYDNPSGPDASVFSLSPGRGPATLLNNQTKTVVVSCKPTAFRSFQAIFSAQVTYGTPKQGAFPLDLKCKGVGQAQIVGQGPLIDVVGEGAGEPLAFGNQEIQTTSAPRLIRIPNNGTAAFDIVVKRDIDEAAFKIAGMQFAFQRHIIPPGQTLTLTITFKPSQVRGYAERLLFNNGSNSFGVVITGKGVAPKPPGE